MLERGFTEFDVRRIVVEGKASFVPKGGFYNKPQWLFVHKNNVVVFDASNGKIITVFSNAPKAPGIHPKGHIIK